MTSTLKFEDEPTKIDCQPPDNEMTDDIPVRKRQRQAYKKIMNKTRFNEVCNNLVGILIITQSIATIILLTPDLSKQVHHN
jgi:hypothetical protein